MTRDNFPDDWGNYYSRCDCCGRRIHASGTEDCDCRECEGCSTLTADGGLDDDGLCESCQERGRCDGCGAFLDDCDCPESYEDDDSEPEPEGDTP